MTPTPAENPSGPLMSASRGPQGVVQSGLRLVPPVEGASRLAARTTTPAAADSPEAPLPRPLASIRVLVPTLAVVLLALAVTGAAVIAERNSRTIMMREMETRLLLEARTLASTGGSALLGEFPELTLHPIVRDMLSERPELAFAAIVDHKGLIQGHAEARVLGTPYHAPTGLVATRATIPLKADEQLLESRTQLVAVAPIATPTGARLGFTVVAMKRAYLEGAIADSRRQQSLLLIVLLVLGAVSTFAFTTVLLRPIGDLHQGLERIGRGDLDTPLVTRDRTELGLLAHTVNRMAAKLKVAQRDVVEKDRLSREVELARGIQQSLLPRGRLVGGRFVIEGTHRAAAEVGGDYYDILDLNEGRVGVAVADVSGKGLGGCLVMSMLSALLRALRFGFQSPSLLLVALEENLIQTLPRGAFVTMFYGVLDPRTGRLTFASAGHTPLLVWRNATREVEWIYGRAIPIGAVRSGALRRMLHDDTLDLMPGDVLVQFTDGYNEAMRGGEGEQFGFARMADVVAGNADRGVPAVVEALGDAVRVWAGTALPMDDETLLVIGSAAVPTPAVASAPAVDGSPVARAANPTPLVMLERARREGAGISLRADFEQLVGIRAWIDRCPGLAPLDPRAARMLESALYEISANVVEHGYQNDPGRTFDLWWVPDASATHDGAHGGSFLLQDHGVPFEGSQTPRINFSDPNVRRRGRGLGIDMVRRIMQSIDYHPGTPEGNLTVMVFDPRRAGQPGGGNA